MENTVLSLAVSTFVLVYLFFPFFSSGQHGPAGGRALWLQGWTAHRGFERQQRRNDGRTPLERTACSYSVSSTQTLIKVDFIVPANKCLPVGNFLTVFTSYDEDFNHEPCQRSGHKAHWAIASGKTQWLRGGSTRPSLLPSTYSEKLFFPIKMIIKLSAIICFLHVI